MDPEKLKEVNLEPPWGNTFWQFLFWSKEEKILFDPRKWQKMHMAFNHDSPAIMASLKLASQVW